MIADALIEATDPETVVIDGAEEALLGVAIVGNVSRAVYERARLFGFLTRHCDGNTDAALGLLDHIESDADATTPLVITLALGRKGHA